MLWALWNYSPTSLFVGTFDVQTVNYSISSEHGICVECELVLGTQAQGCHVELDCDNGDLIEQDFFTTNPTTASGCLPSALNAPSCCTILFFDIEEDSSVSSNSALTFDDVLVSGTVLSSKL